MKVHCLFLMLAIFGLSSLLLGQMTVKDSNDNVLMNVEDEGTQGSIGLSRFAAESAPAIVTDKLYNVAGTLYWNGVALGSTASAGGWTDSGANVCLSNSTDRVGIGTTEPSYELHILGTDDPDLLINSSSNTRYVRIGTNQGGNVSFIEFGQTGVNSSTSWQMGICPDNRLMIGHPGESEKMTILSGGNVGIGTTSPGSNLLAVNGEAAKPGGGHWASYSDRRLKKISSDYGCGLEEICRLAPVRYSYLENNELGLPADQEHVGLVAQDVASILPEAVEENSNGYLMVNQDPIMWAMVNAIKTLKAENDSLRTIIEKRLGALEKLLQ
jgi:hypothetical protein